MIWGNFKKPNIYTTEVPKGEGGGSKNLFALIAKHFFICDKSYNLTDPSARNMKDTTPRHNRIQLLKSSHNENYHKSSQTVKL